jgi:hypothetical protein
MADEPAARRRRVRRKKGPHRPMGAFYLVRPAGRTYSEVKVLYTPGKGKC